LIKNSFILNSKIRKHIVYTDDGTWINKECNAMRDKSLSFMPVFNDANSIEDFVMVNSFINIFVSLPS